MSPDIISKALADQYEQHMAAIQEASVNVQGFSVQLWTSIVEVYRRRLWKARFNYQEEWFDYMVSLGIYGISRASIAEKCAIAIGLINGGASPLNAGEAVALRPGAARRLAASPAVFSAAVKDQTPDEYLSDLIALPSAGEAFAKVADDLGNSVAMWIGDVISTPDRDKVLAVLHRSDEQGYHAYDLMINILPQRPDSPPITSVVPWLVSKIKAVGRFKEKKT